jgi:hypothetical protein
MMFVTLAARCAAASASTKRSHCEPFMLRQANLGNGGRLNHQTTFRCGGRAS